MKTPVRPAMVVPQIDVQEAARRLKAGEAHLIDVREDNELALVSIPGAQHLPMSQIGERAAEVPTDKPVMIICHHGGRSHAVAQWLQQQDRDASNVGGGIDAWAAQLDPTMARY